MKQSLPYVSAISMVDNEGKVKYTTTFHTESLFHLGRLWPYYTAFLDNATLFAKESYIKIIHSREEEKDYIVIGRPIHNKKGYIEGYIFAAIDILRINLLLNSITSHQDFDLAIAMSKDNVFTVTNSGNSQNPVFKRVLHYIETHPNSNEEEVMTFFSRERYPPLVSINNLPHLPFKVVMVLPHYQMLEYWSYHRTSYILFFALLLVFILAIYIYTTSMSKHIHKAQQSEQAALLASQAKSEFLAKMSHELRTPLNAIIGFSEMMEGGYFGPLNDKQQERTKDINLCGTHLLELINDILEFSKGEAGKLTLQEEVITVNDIIDKAIRIMGEKAKNENVTILYEPNNEMPLLKADKRKIRQICLNLLSNAVKFSKEGGVVRIFSWVDTQGRGVIMVEDHGIGMFEEDIPKALSVFGQVHDNPKHGGAGLGLPLCKMIAELHGGIIKIVSSIGIGTKVYVILPSERLINLPYEKHFPSTIL